MIIRSMQGETYTDPGVFERFGCCDPLGGVHRKHTVDEVLGFGCNRVPFRRWVLQNNVHNLAKSQ